MKPGDTLVVEARTLDAILDTLRRRGHTLVGPTIRDGAIVLDEIDGGGRPAAGRGRRAGRRALSPARARRRRLLRLRRRTPRLEALPAPRGRGALAGPAGEARLRGRGRPGATAELRLRRRARRASSRRSACRTGSSWASRSSTRPTARGASRPSCWRWTAARPPEPASAPRSERDRRRAPGIDLALTELTSDGRHELVVEVGSERGAEVLEGIDHRSADAGATWRRRLRSRRRPSSAWAARSTPRA